MRNAGLVGLRLKRRFKKGSRAITSDDLVNRSFARAEPDRLWVTDISEHRTREGKLYCCVVLDATVRGRLVDRRRTDRSSPRTRRWRSRTADSGRDRCHATTARRANSTGRRNTSR